MKKLVRRLSTRNPSPRTHSPHGPGWTSSTSTPIPPNVHIHFPECPHATPPTPRPAYVPPVLRTEVTDKSPSMHDSGIGLSPDRNADNANENIEVRQFFSSPRRCLDCTLAAAHAEEKMIRSSHHAATHSLRLRILELNSGLKVEPEHEPARVELVATEADLQAENEKRDRRVNELWGRVRDQWEGGIREVVRGDGSGDGSGEGEEMCSFVFYGEDGEIKVEIIWVPC